MEIYQLIKNRTCWTTRKRWGGTDKKKKGGDDGLKERDGGIDQQIKNQEEKLD